MNDIQVTFTREELQDLWFACVDAAEKAERDNLKYTAEDLSKLRNKLCKILLNN